MPQMMAAIVHNYAHIVHLKFTQREGAGGGWGDYITKKIYNSDNTSDLAFTKVMF